MHVGNRDFRIEATRLTPREAVEHYRSLVGQHLISVAGLWPTRRDYTGLRSSWAKDLLAGVTVGVVVPTHFDFFDTPLEAAGERVSLSTFEREMREIGWTAEVRIPKPLEWVDWGGEPACT